MRRVAALREMADLGCTKIDACSLLDLEYGSIYFLSKKFSIDLRASRLGRPGHVREKIIRDFAKEGINYTMMAERYGTTRQSVRVIVCQLRKEGKLPPVQERC
jgi:hypothetical protein